MKPRLAIVTGAAGGLGRAFCRQLAGSDQWHVVAVDVDGPALDQTLAEIELPGLASGEAVVMDVTDAQAWCELLGRLQTAHPQLNLLINNAGVCMSAEVGESPLDEWRRILEVNYLGVLYGCHTMLPWLKRAAAGAAVINVASIAAHISLPGMGAYSSSKAAVLSLSETMYAECRGSGLRVTAVTPGVFRTGLLNNAAFTSRRRRAFAEQLARKSKFTSDEVARAALAASARGRLYVAVGRQARILWRCKRMAPTTLLAALGRRYRRILRSSNRQALRE